MSAEMVPGAGLEPARLVQGRRILSPLCLPISPSGRNEARAEIESASAASQAAARRF
jgi:hypothetical protein